MTQVHTLAIEPPYRGRFALAHLGFRPFFLGAAGFAVLAMLLWLARYQGIHLGGHATYPGMIWHAHEMIFGYAGAVMAGFLLTAVKNWTGRQTLHGNALLGLATCWLIARLTALTGAVPLLVPAIFDLLFLLGLVSAVFEPIVRGKHWRHVGMISKAALLIPANLLFYLGLFGVWPSGLKLGLYLGFYTIVALILAMGRRVIPFFIERGVGCPFEARRNPWLDRLSLGLFLPFALVDTLAMTTGQAGLHTLAGVLALIQVPLHSLRLRDWHHPGIWRKPLLWVLFLAYGWLLVGLVLKALTLAIALSPYIAIHAFAIGGIGMMTVGMMARVTIGHTGRLVNTPPPGLTALFLIIFAAALVRVGGTALWPAHDSLWIVLAQLLWITAFGLFLRQFAAMLIKPRIDRRYG